MEILFVLVPVSVLLVLALIAVFAWALGAGQFDDLEREGGRILEDDKPRLEADQSPRRAAPRHSNGAANRRERDGQARADRYAIRPGRRRR
jgi:cbb3-type cytochrome oxidase maturation protein